jgi:hypothetical protein
MKILLVIGLVVAACLLTHHALNQRPESAWAAVQANDRRALGEWLDKGTSVEERNANGQPLLTFAVINESCRTVRLLLERGANANVLDQLGHSPVYYAANLANMKLVHLLVDHGADTESCDPEVVAALRQSRDLSASDFPWQTRTDAPTVRGRPEPGSEMGRL